MRGHGWCSSVAPPHLWLWRSNFSAYSCYFVVAIVEKSDLAGFRLSALMFLQMEEDLKRRLQRAQVQVVYTGSVSEGCSAFRRLKVGTERQKRWLPR